MLGNLVVLGLILVGSSFGVGGDYGIDGYVDGFIDRDVAPKCIGHCSVAIGGVLIDCPVGSSCVYVNGIGGCVYGISCGTCNNKKLYCDGSGKCVYPYSVGLPPFFPMAA